MGSSSGRVAWLRRLIHWAVGKNLPVDFRSDCRSLVENLATCHAIEDKRLAVQLEAIKDEVTLGNIRSVKLISGLLNPADALTKRAPQVVIDRLREIMGGELRDVW